MPRPGAVPLARPGAHPVRAARSFSRRQRVPLWRYLLDGEIATAFTAPLIYALVVPFGLLDASVSVYQAICFRAWGIRRVRRREYFAIDRHQLPYLNALERLNCLYCSYANGVIAFVREIAARTEQHWCPIRHARLVRGAHHRYPGFAGYGDAGAYRDRLPVLRRALKR